MVFLFGERAAQENHWTEQTNSIFIYHQRGSPILLTVYCILHFFAPAVFAPAKLYLMV
jgi:hypothetical protein